MRNSLTRPVVLALAMAFALAACGKSEVDEKDADPGTVASKVAAADMKPQPGRWETTLKLEAMDMPGLPPEAKAMMAKSMGVAQKFATCLSQEQAARPTAEFFNQGKSGCTYDNFTMGDGTLNGTMTCRNDGQTMHITMVGNYTSESYEVRTNSKVSMPGGQSMSQTVTMNARRAGDCRGDEIGKKAG